MCSAKRFHAVDLQDLFSALARRRGALWIDRDEAGARSFMAFAPVAQLRIEGAELAPGLAPLESIAAFVSAAGPLEFAPGQFVPHVAGVLAYDLGRAIEPRVLADVGFDPRTPAVLLHRYDAVAVVVPNVVVAGRECVDLCVVARRPEDLLAWDELIDEVRTAPPRDQSAPAANRSVVPAAPPRPSDHPGEDPDRARHAAAVEQALDFIAAGDVYELNLASHFQRRSTLSPADLYWRLRDAQRVPFGAFLPWEPVTLLCRSPERFLAVDGETIRTQPIKGTRPRATAVAADRALAEELEASVKERAEHVMVVDLERNDLGRVCRPGSVRVSSLARLEEFRTVHHLVSTVEGHLRDEIRLPDILRATFPGGSITGAPKIRAMQLIAALEARPRGLYTGCVIWFSTPRHFDSCITIRSALALPPEPGDAHRGRLWEYAVGGGIVADSDPAQEVEELWWKAGPFLSATGSGATVTAAAGPPATPDAPS